MLLPLRRVAAESWLAPMQKGLGFRGKSVHNAHHLLKQPKVLFERFRLDTLPVLQLPDAQVETREWILAVVHMLSL